MKTHDKMSFTHNKYNMTFTQLEIFALIAELKAFTATAEKLGISQSAVSHALKSLEQQWGINLISRTQSDIELTTTGQQLLTHVKELLSISDTLEKKWLQSMV